jgi:hypothetical protein
MKDNHIDKLINHELDKATEGLFISAELRSRIKAETIEKPRTRLDILKAFLNLKIEIPLVPIVATAAIVIVIVLTPFKGFKTFHRYSEIVVPSQYETIDIGGASIIVDKNAEGDDFHVNVNY